MHGAQSIRPDDNNQQSEEVNPVSQTGGQGSTSEETNVPEQDETMPPIAPGSEDIRRWLDELDQEELDRYLAEDDGTLPGGDDAQEEPPSRRPRLGDDAMAYGRIRGGPPRNPDGSVPAPPPGYDAEGFPIGPGPPVRHRRQGRA